MSGFSLGGIERFRNLLLPASIVGAGIIIAGGIFAFSDFARGGPSSVSQAPQWTEEADAGVSVPACGSSTACGASGDNVICASSSCSAGVPRVEFTWDVSAYYGCSPFNYTGIWYMPPGYTSFDPTYAIPLTTTPQACPTGSYTWTGAANNTTYYYGVAYPDPATGNYHDAARGSFTTPNCGLPLEEDYIIEAGSLTVSGSINPAPPFIEGETLTFNSVVKNVGGQDALANSTARFRLDINTGGSFSWAAPDPEYFNPTSPLAVGATETEQWTWIAAAGTHRFEVFADIYNTVSEGTGGGEDNNFLVSDTFIVNPASLSTVLWASTDAASWVSTVLSGIAPFNGVDLRAIISGTAFGTANFTFYCDNANAGITIDPGFAAKYDTVDMSTSWGPGLASASPNIGSIAAGGNFTIEIVAPDRLIVQNACSYSTGGTKQPKVIVERGPQAFDHMDTGIQVGWPALSGATCSASPATQSKGGPVTWSSTQPTGGDGVNYTYDWELDVACLGEPSSGCKSFTTSYPTAGTRTGRVKIESGGQQFTTPTCQVTILDTTVNFSAVKTFILPGETTQLQWTTTGYSDGQCVINQGPWVANPAVGGTKDVSPLVTTQYTLTCNDGSGDIVRQATVTVGGSPTFKEVPPQ